MYRALSNGISMMRWPRSSRPRSVTPAGSPGPGNWPAGPSAGECPSYQGAALALIASLLGAGPAEPIPQNVEQSAAFQARTAGEVDQIPLQFRAALDKDSEPLLAASPVDAGCRPSAASRRLTSFWPNGSGSSGSSSDQYSTGETAAVLDPACQRDGLADDRAFPRPPRGPSTVSTRGPYCPPGRDAIHPASLPAPGTKQSGCSADTDGLPLGLDHGHDALLRSGVGRAGVLDGQLVDDLPRRVARRAIRRPARGRQRAGTGCRRARWTAPSEGRGAGCVLCVSPDR